MDIKWKDKKSKVLQSCNGKCYHCGKAITIYEMHIDHYIPKSKGGKDTKNNWVASCVKCNLIKSNKLPIDFIKEVKKRISKIEVELAFYKDIVNVFEVNGGAKNG